MTCHSGTASNLKLIDFDDWPSTDAAKSHLCRDIAAYARSAVTGDNTVQAAKEAIERIVEERADDYFVILLSDANLGRYNVSPKDFGKVLTADSRVHATAIFIAEPSASEWMSTSLPLGRGHVCLDPQGLPKILAEIFEQAINRPLTTT